jgi:hypothetical protein
MLFLFRTLHFASIMDPVRSLTVILDSVALGKLMVIVCKELKLRSTSILLILPPSSFHIVFSTLFANTCLCWSLLVTVKNLEIVRVISKHIIVINRINWYSTLSLCRPWSHLRVWGYSSVWTLWKRNKPLASVGKRTTLLRTSSPSSDHCTDWAIRAVQVILCLIKNWLMDSSIHFINRLKPGGCCIYRPVVNLMFIGPCIILIAE